MAIRIAHISDVHFNRVDLAVADRLLDALRTAAPDVIVITGDLADHPWKIPPCANWIELACEAAGVDSDTSLFVVPGNHDFRAWGNFGFKPITGWYFRKTFGKYFQPVRFLPEFNATLISIDSNPIAFGMARGRVTDGQIAKIARELDRDDQRKQIANSIKIAALHHHTFPVPYEGNWKDKFLVLENANNLLQFIADRGISLILHGHNHMAPHSVISLGTCQGTKQVIDVVGAGTAVAGGTDREARGHNFNLITIEDTGLTYVSQYFALPSNPFLVVRPLDPPLHSLEEVFVRARDQRGYSYSGLHWDALLDEEGDTFNEISYTGLQAIRPLPSIEKPPYTCNTGHLSTVWLNQGRTSQGVTIQLVKEEPREVTFRIGFRETPTRSKPIDYSLLSYDLNTISLDRGEFRRKFPQAPVAQEWEEMEILEPFEEFSWLFRFPAGYRSAGPPRFEVIDDKTNAPHEWLTAAFQQFFRYSVNADCCFARIHKPPPNCRYRISWDLPAPEPLPKTNPAHQIIVSRIRLELLAIRDAVVAGGNHDRHEDLRDVLLTFRSLVASEIEEQVGTGILNVENLEASLMVYDDRAADAVPLLRVVSATHEDQNRSLEFSLEIGDGNAGRAYKNNTLRSYDAANAHNQPKQETYYRRDSGKAHQYLYSMPLRHPDSQHLIVGVLNIGSYEHQEANLLGLLETDEEYEWLLTVAQSYVLIRLCELLNIDLGGGA